MGSPLLLILLPGVLTGHPPSFHHFSSSGSLCCLCCYAGLILPSLGMCAGAWAHMRARRKEYWCIGHVSDLSALPYANPSFLPCSFFKIFTFLGGGAMLGFSWGMQDLVPWPGIKPGSPALGTRNLSHWTKRDIPPLHVVTYRKELFFFFFFPLFVEPGKVPKVT